MWMTVVKVVRSTELSVPRRKVSADLDFEARNTQFGAHKMIAGKVPAQNGGSTAQEKRNVATQVP